MATRFPVATTPASDLANFRRAFEPFFAAGFGPAAARTFRSTATSTSSAAKSLPLDVFTQGDDIVVVASVPGIDPDAIEILVEKNKLTIRGKVGSTADSATSGESTWYLHELPSGPFARALTLPFDVDAARVEAIFDRGQLRLTLPKLESSKPRQIRVKVAGAPDAIATEATSADENSSGVAESAAADTADDTAVDTAVSAE